MKKEVFPLMIIIASFILMLVNIIIAENFDKGFWMQILSSVLVIAAMALTIHDRKKQEKNRS